MKRIQEFLTLSKHKSKTLLVSGPLDRNPRVIETVQTAIRLCSVNYHVLFNLQPLGRPVYISADTPICIVIDSEDILDNRWVKKHRNAFKIIVVHHDRYAGKIRTFREAAYTSEVILQSTTRNSPFQVLTVLSSRNTRMSLEDKLRYLESKDTYMLPYYVQENLPRLCQNINHLLYLMEQTSAAEALGYCAEKSIGAIVHPLYCCQRSDSGVKKPRYETPKMRYYQQ